MTSYDFQNLRTTSNNNENKKLFITIALSMFFLTIWQIFTTPNEEELKKKVEKIKVDNAKYYDEIYIEKQNEIKKVNNKNIKKKDKNEIFLKNENVHVGFDVANNRISFLALKKYKQHEKSIKNIVLLDDEHFIENGWIGTYRNEEIDWKLNKKGKDYISIIGEKNNLKFETIYKIDNNYGIIIKQILTNETEKDLKISPYSRASIKDTKDRIENNSAFRGVLLMNDSKIKEIKYESINKQNMENKTNNNGWIGISDQYWITALLSKNDIKKDSSKCNNYVEYYDKKQKNTNEQCIIGTIYSARYNKDKNIYQIDFSSVDDYILKGNNKNKAVYETIALVGPKKLENLDKFEKTYNAEKIDKVIDFGFFYFISKPLLKILKRLYSITGNFGISIILLTILVRMIILPLANRSYKAMAKMKKIQPRIKDLQEKYQDDKKTLQMEMYKVYKEENINPMASVFPLLLQIPIFFALYKVLIISIEMRDAPFFGWIVDLSSKDPSSIFNLFGLLNFDVPYALQIGVLPLIMGFTMWLQQLIQPMNINIDKTQQKIIKLMPILLTLMLSSMPAGLVLYWSCSNIFTIFQQVIIIKLNKDK